NRVGIGNPSPSYKLDVNGTGRFTSTLTASGGIDGLTNTNGISGSNFNITGVNQITINDPGEGILFGGGTNNVTLYAIDDSTDNKMNFGGASELQVNGSTVWHAGNDGVGSQLNADYLDGEHGSYYQNAGNLNAGIIPVARLKDSYVGLSPTESFVQYGRFGATPPDLNTVLQSGIYGLYSSTAANNPSNSSSYDPLLVMKGGTDVGVQVVFPRSGTNSTLAFRGWSGSGSSWTNWKYVWHSENDGSGSGLDADTVDTFHASTTRNSANTIPVRDGNGYLQLGWINTTSGNTTTASSDYYVNTNDGYIRKKTLANVRTEIMGVSSGSSFLRSDEV
ncbi:MAG: pyocin knob domain-containing protein, partial [Methylophilaceae bacterium]